MNIIVSAPGKIHLLGEHSVVYGRPALLSAVNRRLYVEVKSQNFDGINIETSENNNLVKQIISLFKNAFKIDKLPPLQIKITSQIPIGSGMGSSAAISAALIGALMKFVKNIWNPNRINELAYEAEKIAHGNPSGADNTTVIFGGLVWYRKEFDFLKSIWSLPVLSYKIPNFVLIDTGRPEESTKEMVDKVSQFLKRKKGEGEKILSDQETQTKKLLLALRQGNDGELKSAIIAGERNLEKLGVVGKTAESIIRQIEKAGGASKISGGGGFKKGSGILLGYHKDLSVIKKISDEFNFHCYLVKLGEEGIRIEKSSNDKKKENNH